MFRRHLAVASLALLLVLGLYAGRAPATALAVTGLGDNCLDPSYPNLANPSGNANAVSIWHWVGSNSHSGNFTAVQSNTGDSSTAGQTINGSLDTVAIHGLLDTDWTGTLDLLGGTDSPTKKGLVFLIANTSSIGGGNFMIAFLNRSSTTASFQGFALGTPFGFASYTATLTACYTNLAPNPAFEVGPSGLSGWTCTASCSLTQWVQSPASDTDKNTGKNALQASESWSSCPNGGSAGVWSTGNITVNQNTNYVFGGYEESKAVSPTISSPPTVVGSITLDEYSTSSFLFPFAPVKIGTLSIPLSGSKWGFGSQLVTIPTNNDPFTGVSFVVLSLHTDFNCTAGETGAANFDDVFLMQTDNGPRP